MRRLLILLALLCLAVPANATPAIVHSNLSTTSTTISSTTAGDGFVLITGSASTPTAAAITGGDSMTKWGCLPTSVSSQHRCVFYPKQETSGGHTAFSCTGCGTVNAYTWAEISGQDTATFIDHVIPCFEPSTVPWSYGTDGTTPTVEQCRYDPGFSSEVVLYGADVTGTCASAAGTGATWSTSVASGGNPGGSAISSGFGQLTFTPAVASCGVGNAIMLGIIGAGATQSSTCAWDIGYHDYGAQITTGSSMTVSANFEQSGNLILTAGYVLAGATGVSVSDGTDSFTQSFSGTSSSDTGQVFLHYLLGNTVTGAQTITATITGSHSNAQIGYAEFIPSAKCTMAHDADSSVGTGSGATANTPSITATAGALEWIYTAAGSGTHVSHTNSPWVCNVFALAGETGDCTYVNSRNAFGYVLSATGSATANNMSTTTGTWQAGASSFKLTPTGAGAVEIPRRRFGAF